jgi:hypothetical protein
VFKNPDEPVVVIAELVRASGAPVAALVEIVTISLAVAGESVVPLLDQYPIAPEVGAVDVRFFEPSV